MVRTGHPLSPCLSPQALRGPVPGLWAYGTPTVPSGIQGQK